MPERLGGTDPAAPRSERTNPISACAVAGVANRVSWSLDLREAALLLHDVQPHYLSALPPEVRAGLVGTLRSLLAACREAGVPIFASQVPPADTPEERGLMRDMWGPGPASGAGERLEPALGLDGEEVRSIRKRSYSAFYGTDFEVMLRRLGRRSLIITGVFTSIGCLISATDAFMRDIRTFVVADACADFDAASHLAGLQRAACTCARVIAAADAAAG